MQAAGISAQLSSGRAQALAAPAAVLELCCLWGREPQHRSEEQVLEEPAWVWIWTVGVN